MSDPLERPGDRMFTAAAEYGHRVLGWKDGEDDRDPVDGLLERAENANSPELGLAYAQMATARAIQQQTEQARISNLLALAQFDHHAEGETRLYTGLDGAQMLRIQAAVALGVDLS